MNVDPYDAMSTASRCGKKLPRIFQKIGTTSGAKVGVDPNRLKACVAFKAGGYQAPMNEEIFQTVLDALSHQQELSFPYLSIEARRDAAASSIAMNRLMRPSRATPSAALCRALKWELQFFRRLA